MDSVVQRLHRALAEALQRRRPDLEAAPVTVAEIYQELVPYRAVRVSLGFDMNADYEHALLRLLAGEEALVRVEPEEVRQQLERELATPNPDVTLFRQFAACDVWVSAPLPDAGLGPERTAAGSPPPADDADLPAGDDDWTPEWLEAAAQRIMERPTTGRSGVAPEAAEPPAGSAAEPAPADPAGAATGQPARVPPAAAPEALERDMPRAAPSRTGNACAFCHTALPPDRPVRYCPYCGVDQQLRPCARCGEILEPGWRYCASCGAPAPAGAA